MSNKIAVWGLIIVAILIAAGYYIFFVLKPAVNDPMEVIPDNAVFVIQLDKPSDFYKKISTENEIWTSLKKSRELDSFLDQIELIDSLIANNTSLASIKVRQALISVHFDTTFNESQVLYSIELNKSIPDELINEFSKHFQISPSEHYPDVHSITNKETNFEYFAGFTNDILLVSKQDWMINRVQVPPINEKAHFSTDKSFVKLRSTSGKNADARIFINYNWLSKMMKNSLDISSRFLLDGFEEFAGWSETDLLIKNDEFLFSGFTYPAQKNYLRKFSNQQPGKIGTISHVPFNTSMLLALNFSDINQIVDQKAVNKLSKSLNFKMTELLALADNEIASASNAPAKNLVEDRSWFFIKMKNINKAKQYLDLISSNTGVKTGTNYRNITTRNIKYKGLIPELFGKPYDIFQNSWYTVINDYVVFANSQKSLNILNDYYESGKTLDLEDNFNVFSDNIAASSNILLYINPRYISGLLNKYLNTNTVTKLNNNEALLSDFQGISFQFTSSDSIFYTNFYLRNDKKTMQANLDLWRVELDSEITGKPYLVRDHTNNKLNIVVYDIESNIYLISADGQVLWKKKLDNIPESGIYPLDYYKNGKIQYLLNTRDFIYLLDKNGNKVENFPKKINPSATNGLSLFDYDNNKNYRVMIAQADKRLYNYTESGNKVEGWLRPKSENIVTEPVVHLASGGLDYLIVTDINNNINIINRRGEQRIKLNQKLERARNSGYYINKTNSKGIILTSDKYGRLTYISSSGKIQHTEFGEYSADHYFLYEDFTGNGASDFIYIEGDQLNVFNRFKEVLFNYEFPSQIKIKPVFFKLGRNQSVLGVVDKDNKTIYLFDKSGQPIISSGLVGENLFTVGSLNNDKEINLITSVGKTLYNYRLQ